MKINKGKLCIIGSLFGILIVGICTVQRVISLRKSDEHVSFVFDLLKSVMLSRSLVVAAELNIAERLTEKPMALAELAVATTTNQDALGRLMYFLSLNDIFVKDDAGRYTHTKRSLLLSADHPQTIKPFVLHDDETRWNAYGHLGQSIKSGKDSFAMLYGMDYFSYIKKSPLLRQRFDDAMVIISHHEDKMISEKLPFIGRICDIGGGKGDLVKNIVDAHKQVTQAIVYDLAETIEQVGELPDRCSKQSGDFFKPLDVCADTYILKRILHDWQDQQAVIILKNIVHAMPDSSTLIIIESVIDRVADKKLMAAIDLALLAIFNGKERTLDQFGYLCREAGLKIQKVTQITDTIFALGCRKG